MKVVHVINRVAIGGAERQLAELVRRSTLHHEVVELDVITASRLTRASRLAAELRARTPDVVAAWLERPQIALALVRNRVPIPRVACARNLPSPRRPAFTRPLFRVALRRYDVLVANSDAVRNAFRAIGVRETVVIPNGVDLPESRPAPPRQGPLRVGFIGRAAPAKGLDVLAAAFGRFDVDEVRGVLVGPGIPEWGERYGVGPPHGLLPAAADPWQAAGEIDVLAVPSRWEGSPNVVLEAFARCIPVVGTTVGGMAELLAEDRGLAVPPDDPDALVSALRHVAADPESARRRAELARSYVEQRHAWPAVVSAYDELFAALARGR